jgi:hypothetical protein
MPNANPGRGASPAPRNFFPLNPVVPTPIIQSTSWSSLSLYNQLFSFAGYASYAYIRSLESF